MKISQFRVRIRGISKIGETILENLTKPFIPTTMQERINALDVLRGFSLLGILLVNMIAFYTPQPYIDLGSWFTDASDIIWHQRLDIYVQSSFYPLFSMLFGYGFAMQWMKANQTGIAFYSVGFRRLLALFAIGVVHAFAIWWGDILMVYAFCGAFLLLLLRFQPITLIATAVLLNLLFHAFMLFFVGYIYVGNEPMEAASVDITAVEQAITAYGTGNWIDAFLQRVQDTLYQNNPFVVMLSLLTILPYMIVGAVASKWRLIERAKELKLLWLVIGITFVGMGLFIKSAPFTFERTYLLDYLKVYVGGPILAIGYVAVIITLLNVRFLSKLLQLFAKAGRMSITIYLMQSIILSILFYKFGFGLYGKIDVQTGIVMAIIIFIVQVVFAELWLSKFKQGPIEAFWRKITYGKLLSKK